MARLFIDGFESNDFSVCVAENSPAISTTPTVKTGNYCAYLSSNRVKYTLAASKASVYLAFKVIPGQNRSARNIMQFATGATIQGCLRMSANDNSAVLQAYSGDAASLLGSGTTTLTAGGTVAYLIEVYYLPHASNGSFVVKVNGTTEINVTGAATAPSTANTDGIFFGSNSSYLQFYLDDVVCDDAGWIGNTKIQAIVPSGAGTTTQWDPSTGSNYACVDEIAPSDADYVSTNTTGEIDTYAFGNLTGVISSVKCVQVQARAAYEGSPTPTKIQLGCRSGGADYFSGDLSPGVSFTVFRRVMETDPATSAAWTADGVNNAEFGVKAVA